MSTPNPLPTAKTIGLGQIKVTKGGINGMLPNRKASLLKRMDDIESELGRLTKLLREMRADVLHLTIE